MLKLLIFDKGGEGQFLETTTHREGTHSGQVDSLLEDIDSRMQWGIQNCWRATRRGDSRMIGRLV